MILRVIDEEDFVTSRASIIFTRTLFPNATHHSDLTDVHIGQGISSRLHYQGTKQDRQYTFHANTVAVNKSNNK
jgi:hypothetical protein